MNCYAPNNEQEQITEELDFSLLHLEFPQILVLCLPLYLLSKSLKNIRVIVKLCEKAGVKILRDLTEKSVSVNNLATSKIRLLLFFGKEDQ